MFENLTDKFERAFKVLKGQGQITEINVAETLKEVRRALLDADVSFNTAKQFTNTVKEKALGKDVLNAVSPGQLMIKICHEELIELMGGNEVEINLKGAPAVILMSGLQGSGKTTFTGKLGSYLQNKKGKKVLLVACDVYRPATIDQLHVLGEQLSIDVYSNKEEKNPIAIAQAAIAHAKSNGFNVVVTYRSGNAPTGFNAVKMDVTDSASVDSGFAECEEKFGIPEIIVCNAGITKDGLVMRMSDEDFNTVIDANLGGAFRTARRATKGLLKLKRGRLIFIGSVVGGIGSAGQVNYSASKSGLLGMARSFARELGSRRITANVIAPGFVETDMTAELTQARRDEIAKAVPMQRFCSAEEIAQVVSFIASDAASYISGALIPVDGGLGMGH